MPEVFNFADDTTFHACDNDLNNLIKRLDDWMVWNQKHETQQRQMSSFIFGS